MTSRKNPRVMRVNIGSFTVAFTFHFSSLVGRPEFYVLLRLAVLDDHFINSNGISILSISKINWLILSRWAVCVWWAHKVVASIYLLEIWNFLESDKFDSNSDSLIDVTQEFFPNRHLENVTNKELNVPLTALTGNLPYSPFNGFSPE